MYWQKDMAKISHIFLNKNKKMETGRNRSTGWQHAKLTGHINESNVEKLFSDDNFKRNFCERIGILPIEKVKVGGLYEKDVDCILGGKTKSKTDLQLELSNGSLINISIKKGLGGQVYLIGVDRFISGFEKQFNKKVPDDINEFLHFYFYGNEKTSQILSDRKFIEGMPPTILKYQKNHNRLVWEHLCRYNKDRADNLLNWFKYNISEITEFCFSRGLAINESEWAHYVWYINLLGEEDVDMLISIDEIKKSAANHADQILPGSKNGGSTIQLPFGFVQWHQCQIQFHHSFSKISDIIRNEIE